MVRHRRLPRMRLLLGVFVVISVLIGLWWSTTRSSPTTTRVESPPGITMPLPAGYGRMTGRATEMNGTVPDDFIVCAEPTLGGSPTCVAPEPDGQYVLDLLPGQYHLSAYQPATPTLRGWYTETSAGLEGTSTPMIVNVSTGQTLEGINPDDWS